MTTSDARSAAGFGGQDSTSTSDAPSVAPMMQLTYAAATDGYRVQDALGEPRPGEVSEIVARIPARAGFGVDIPDFLSHEGIEARPRRLKFSRIEAGSAFWHLSPAGRDTSGRPNNVFTHAMLIRGDSWHEGVSRPVELWRSPDWLAPFGPDGVAKAELRCAPTPRAGAIVDRASVLDFLTDTRAWRGDVLAVVLDAIAGEAPHPVVLGVESEDNAALWIGAVSFFMSRATAWATGFSVLETPGTVGELKGSEIAIACVPRQMLGDVVGPQGAVIIDESADVTRGRIDGPPHRFGGTEVRVTPWSGLVDAVLSLADDIAAETGRIDELAATVGDTELSYAWPLAMTLAENLDEYGDVADQALAVIEQHTPDRVGAHPHLIDIIDALVNRAIVPRGAKRWEAFSAHPQRSPVVTGSMRAAYIRSALRDPQWLLAPGGIPQPEHSLLIDFTPEQTQDVTSEVIRWLSSGGSQAEDEATRATRILRGVDLCYRLGYRPAQAAADLRRAVQANLNHSDAVLKGIADAAPLDPTFLREIVRPALTRELAKSFDPLDDDLTHAVIKVLFPQGVDTLAAEVADGVAAEPTEWDIRAILADPPLARQRPHLAAWALRALLSDDAAGLRARSALARGAPQLLRALYSDGRPNCSDVHTASAAGRGVLPDLVVVSALFNDAGAPEAGELCSAALRQQELDPRWRRAYQAFQLLTSLTIGVQRSEPMHATAASAINHLEFVMNPQICDDAWDLIRPQRYLSQRVALGYLIVHAGLLSEGDFAVVRPPSPGRYPARSDLAASPAAFAALIREFKDLDARRMFFCRVAVLAVMNHPDFDGAQGIEVGVRDRVFDMVWVKPLESGRSLLEASLIEAWHVFIDNGEDVKGRIETIAEEILGSGHGQPLDRHVSKFVKTTIRGLERESKGGWLGALR